jgi:endonuclease YncB( thermonuclease family)
MPRMGRSWLLVIGPALALVACAGPSSSYARPAARSGDPVAPIGAFTARVQRVVDGDTFIAVRRGRRLRVRLIGVDAPETVKPGAPVGCWGPQASRLLHLLLPPGIPVRAAYQPGGHLDRYHRELWDVWLPGGRFLQAVLVRRGAARAVAYRPQVAHAAFLALLDARAAERRRGLHGSCAARAP